MTQLLHCDNPDCDSTQSPDRVLHPSTWMVLEDLIHGDQHTHFCSLGCLATWSNLQTDHWSMDRLFSLIQDWAKQALPNATPQGALQKVHEEVLELLEDPDDLIEAADIIIALVAYSRIKGFNLNAGVAQKMRINMARTWGDPDPHTGVIRHQ